MNCPLFVRIPAAAAALALLLGGCANSSSSVANANASATANAGAAPAAAKPAPERFGSYGVSNHGYSTNLASEVNSMMTGEDNDAPETKVATAAPAGPAPTTAAATPVADARTTRGTAAQQAPVPGQPQVAQAQNQTQNQVQTPPQDPPKSKAQQAEENVPGLYGTPRAPQKDVVHWLLETTKDE